MYLAVNIEAMLMLGYAVCIGFLILFGVPACIGLWRFLKELVQQTKSAQGHLYEIMDDKRAEFFGSYLKEEIKRQNEIGKVGAEAYRKEERSALLKKYRIPMIAAIILLVLAVLLNQWVLQAALVLLEKGGVIKNFSFACLASSVVLVIAVFMGVLCFRLNLTEGAGFAAAVAGGCAGFLVYNAHPAKVFMGDTGSIFLGGALTALSVVYGLEIFWLIAAAVMLWETLSVMIQVASFKLTGKRVFKMSPFHHHLEHCGWGEWKIVGTFSAVTLIICAILLFTL